MNKNIRRIAIASNDGKSVVGQFGYTQFFKVISIDDGKVVDEELREIDLNYDGSDIEENKKNVVSGLSLNVVYGSNYKYQRHLNHLKDCDVVISRKFCGNGILSVERTNKVPILTRNNNFEKCVKEFIDGNLVHHTDRVG